MLAEATGGSPSQSADGVADVPLSRRHSGYRVRMQRVRCAVARPNTDAYAKNLRDCEWSREQLLPAREVSPIADATGGCSFPTFQLPRRA